MPWRLPAARRAPPRPLLPRPRWGPAPRPYGGRPPHPCFLVIRLHGVYVLCVILLLVFDTRNSSFDTEQSCPE